MQHARLDNQPTKLTRAAHPDLNPLANSPPNGTNIIRATLTFESSEKSSIREPASMKVKLSEIFGKHSEVAMRFQIEIHQFHLDHLLCFSKARSIVPRNSQTSTAIGKSSHGTFMRIHQTFGVKKQWTMESES
jgi:hypothetical protein